MGWAISEQGMSLDAASLNNFSSIWDAGAALCVHDTYPGVIKADG